MKKDIKAYDLLEGRTLTEGITIISQDLNNYFEGLSLAKVEFIIDEYRRNTLKDSSIVTIKKS